MHYPYSSNEVGSDFSSAHRSAQRTKRRSPTATQNDCSNSNQPQANAAGAAPGLVRGGRRRRHARAVPAPRRVSSERLPSEDSHHSFRLVFGWAEALLRIRRCTGSHDKPPHTHLRRTDVRSPRPTGRPAGPQRAARGARVRRLSGGFDTRRLDHQAQSEIRRPTRRAALPSGAPARRPVGHSAPLT